MSDKESLRSVLGKILEATRRTVDAHHHEDCEAAHEDPKDRGPCTCSTGAAQEAFWMAREAIGQTPPVPNDVNSRLADIASKSKLAEEEAFWWRNSFMARLVPGSYVPQVGEAMMGKRLRIVEE